MTYRLPLTIGLALLLSLATWSSGLAQRNAQQARTSSYIVVVQVGPATPAAIPEPAPAAPAEVPMVPEEVVGLAESDLAAPGDEDEDAMMGDEENWDENAGMDDDTTEPANMAAPPAPAAEPSPMVVRPTDRGQIATHRLQINVADAAIGALMTDQIPTITITMRNLTTGESRTVTDVSPANDVLSGPSEWHFGSNLYIPEGLYEMTVNVNGETAVFPRVVVPNPAALPGAQQAP